MGTVFSDDMCAARSHLNSNFFFYIVDKPLLYITADICWIPSLELWRCDTCTLNVCLNYPTSCVLWIKGTMPARSSVVLHLFLLLRWSINSTNTYKCNCTFFKLRGKGCVVKSEFCPSCRRGPTLGRETAELFCCCAQSRRNKGREALRKFSGSILRRLWVTAFLSNWRVEISPSWEFPQEKLKCNRAGWLDARHMKNQ